MWPLFVLASMVVEQSLELAMKVPVKWWRRKWIDHIEGGIGSKDFKIKAEEGKVPCLILTWTFENKSEAEVPRYPALTLASVSPTPQALTLISTSVGPTWGIGLSSS